jgi:hypothetical protein
MTTFKEFAIGKFVLRFYKTDHVWTCTATEEMLDEVKKEFALRKLLDISYEIENESFDRTASHMANEYVSHPDELYTLVKSFFEDYLDIQEESDSGRVFSPIHISCVRVMKVEPLTNLLIRMRELSGAKE